MKGDYILSLAILLLPFFAIIQLLLPMYGLFSVERSADLRVYATLITILPAVFVAVKRNLTSVLLPFIMYLFIALIHYNVFPLSHAFLESRKALTLTPIVILTGVFMFNIKDLGSFKEVFLWVSRASVPLALIYVWGRLHSPFLIDDSNYDMSFGYTLLSSTMFLFTQDNAFDKACSLLMWVLIVFGGSRGPAIVAGFFYIISFLLYTDIRRLKVWQVAMLICILLVGIAVLPKLLDFSSSRTVMLFEAGEGFSHDSDRSVLYEIAVSNILEKPFFGTGVGSDWAIMGGYCHNFFLEISLHHGLLISILVCLAIVSSCFSIYKRLRYFGRKDEMQLFILVLIGGIMPLLVSSSYLLNSLFGLTIGLIMRYKYNKSIQEF